jgi:hypothetical protein
VTEDEFWTTIGVMRTVWNHPKKLEALSDTAAEGWWRLGLFSDLDPRDVEAAVAALAATETWPPGPPEIRGWIARHADPANYAVWVEVWRELYEERDRPGPWAAAQWSPAVAPFVEAIGVGMLAQLSRGSDVPLEVVHGQLRRMWEAWREQRIELDTTGTLLYVAAFRQRRGLPARLEAGIVALGDRMALGNGGVAKG